ncbi:type IV pilus modification protein PilV [Hydrogenophaga sp.]|uniref:type IV pilus modification protein PilV n=1 Tax=Hydrogenophaga sp. TaxID=1904254 RepID=UPI003568CFBD
MNPSRIAQKQEGVSLIEALVALLVLALGIMGLAGIQTRTLLEARATNTRSVAIQLAEDLLERMQANSVIRVINPATNPYVASWGVPAAGTDCTAQFCTGDQLASFDIAQWKAGLSQALNGGDARIFRSTTDPSQYGVLIGWSETQAKGQDGAATAETAQFASAIAVNTGVAGITCPNGMICHVVYIRP